MPLQVAELSFQGQSAPAKHDKALAAGVHVSSIFWPFLGPLVAWALFRKRAFVASHARKALTEAFVLKVAVILAFIVSLATTLSQVPHWVETGWKDVDWKFLALRVILGWLALLILEAVNTVFSVRQALRAYQGHWPKSVLKRQAAKAL